MVRTVDHMPNTKIDPLELTQDWKLCTNLVLNSQLVNEAHLNLAVSHLECFFFLIFRRVLFMSLTAVN